ncbi:MFS transporter [Saccharothrix australiensis]|uniref:Putative MFS family arabinose efflux permease n=1 Tax=Saccharothrix australiensis TaxID=2072 RepID=A0A495VYR1_9PSEU|nr:MFS transporter [Saccharothrix australiensis]RKT54389.1 putative MFS family arabinose efflux permease [Saccharothrix australiensis]
MFRVLRGRNYRRWAFADLVSVTGAWMQLIGLNWVVMDRTGSAASVGLSVLVGTLPSVLLGPWAGAVADRVPVRRVILVCQSLHAVLAAALALVVWLHAPITAVFALTAAAGLVSVFDGPALGRFGGQVVAREDLGNALAFGSILNSTGRILGMSSAAVLAAALGAPVLFLVNAVSFLAVIAAVMTVRVGELHPLAVSTAEQAGVRAGLRYIGASGRLLLLFALGFVLSSLGRNYQVTMAAMSDSAAGYGVLSTVFAVGTVLGGLAASLRRALTVRLLLVVAGVTSVLQAAGGLVPGALGFALVLVPIAAGAVVIDTTMSTRLQLDSTDGMRGRLLAVNSSVGAAAGAVGAPLLGWLCERIGAPETLVLAGTLTLIATVLAATVFAAPHQRRAALAHRVLRRPRPVPAPTGHPAVPAGHGHGPRTWSGTRFRRRARVRAGADVVTLMAEAHPASDLVAPVRG